MTEDSVSAELLAGQLFVGRPAPRAWKCWTVDLSASAKGATPSLQTW